MQLQPAIVTAVTPPTIQVSLSYRYTVTDLVVRPVHCGLTTGLHWMPQLNEKVWIAYLAGGKPIALCGLADLDPVRDLPSLPTVQAGETAIYGPTGNVLKAVQAGTIQAGNPNNPFKLVARDGDAIVGTITAPSGGGACSFSLTVQASATVLEAN